MGCQGIGGRLLFQVLLSWLLIAPALAETLVVSVPGPRNISYLPMELIGAIGADRAEGGEVRLLNVGGGGQAIKQLMLRNSDFAVAGLPAQMSARIHGEEVVVLAAVNDAPLFILMVRSQLREEVRSIADLRGRVIGVNTSSLSSKTTSQQLAELLLRAHGVASHEATFLPAGQDWESQLASIEGGRVDAIMGDEPFASRLLAAGKVFFLANLAETDLTATVPGSSFLHAVLSTRPEVVAREPERAARMVRMVRRALDYLATHSPEEVVKVLNWNRPEESGYFLASLRRYPRLYSRDGHFSRRQLRETERFFQAGNPGEPGASTLKLETMIDPRWSGFRE